MFYSQFADAKLDARFFLTLSLKISFLSEDVTPLFEFDDSCHAAVSNKYLKILYNIPPGLRIKLVHFEYGTFSTRRMNCGRPHFLLVGLILSLAYTPLVLFKAVYSSRRVAFLPTC